MKEQITNGDHHNLYSFGNNVLGNYCFPLRVLGLILNVVHSTTTY